MISMAHQCSCGKTEAHKVARRQTIDGHAVILWSDGSITGRLGYQIKDVPCLRPRTESGHDVAMRAGWMLIGECEIYESDEVASLYRSCLRAAKRGDNRPDRTERSAHPFKPVWTIYSADRNGVTTLRVWKLPRLIFPSGLAVWHERGKYELVNVDRHGTARSTGFFFKNQKDLFQHLADACIGGAECR